MSDPTTTRPRDPGPLDAGVVSARAPREGPGWAPPYRSLGQLLAHRAQVDPEAPYLTFFDDERRLVRRSSYGEIAHAASLAAAQMRALGVSRGDRVALLTENLDRAIALYLGAWSLGACMVPLNAAESEERKVFILEHSGAALLYARAEHLDLARRLSAKTRARLVQVEVDGSDAVDPALPSYPAGASALAPAPLDRPEIEAGDCEALLVYTSGTTGDPKGVLLDQRNVMADADAMAQWHGWSKATRMMCVLPIHHVNGLIVSHVTPLYVGGSTVLCARFSGARFWERIASERATTVSVVPTLLQFLLEAPAGPADVQAQEAARSLATVLCGAGPLRVDTALAFEERFGIPLIHGYGLSETTGYNCQLPIDLETAERRRWLSEPGFPSIGCPLPHHEMTILRPDGSAADPFERGEICIRGDTVSRGYAKRPEANAESFRDGWFHSGDEGFRTRDTTGRWHFFITGRMKELIIRGGVNFSPLEIDEVLNAHPDVHFGLAVPFENRYYGEEIAAYVVPVEGRAPREDAILDWCRARLHFDRTPKVVVFGREVPYTTTGKAKRIELARSLADALRPHRDVQFRRPGASHRTS